MRLLRESKDPAFLSIVALVEAIWVLRSRFGVSNDQLSRILREHAIEPGLPYESDGDAHSGIAGGDDGAREFMSRDDRFDERRQTTAAPAERVQIAAAKADCAGLEQDFSDAGLRNRVLVEPDVTDPVQPGGQGRLADLSCALNDHDPGITERLHNVGLGMSRNDTHRYSG